MIDLPSRRERIAEIDLCLAAVEEWNLRHPPFPLSHFPMDLWWAMRQRLWWCGMRPYYHKDGAAMHEHVLGLQDDDLNLPVPEFDAA